MRGKKSGLNVGLRKILAKISREFDFPKVYAVRCHMTARLHTFRDQVALKICQPPMIETGVSQLSVNLASPCRSGRLEDAECHTMTRMEEIATEIHEETCWDTDGPGLHSMDFGFEKVPLHTPLEPIEPPALAPLPFEFADPDLNQPRLIGKTWVRGGPALAKRIPVALIVVPMQELSKMLIIRYRGAVLKQLNLRPNQVKFVGVVTNLPRAPLSIIRYEPNPEGYDKVHIHLAGALNPYLKRRTWVFVRIDGQEKYLPITVKEE